MIISLILFSYRGPFQSVGIGASWVGRFIETKSKRSEWKRKLVMELDQGVCSDQGVHLRMGLMPDNALGWIGDAA